MVDLLKFTETLSILCQEVTMMTHPFVCCTQVILDLVKDHLGLLHAMIEVSLESVVLKHCSVSSEQTLKK